MEANSGGALYRGKNVAEFTFGLIKRNIMSKWLHQGIATFISNTETTLSQI